jgi:hypothetical protein
MQPTHENIDRWLFDYTEGNLSVDQEQQLESFLMDHPELELDADAWDLAKVSVTPMAFDHKSSLYRKRSYKPALALFSLLIFISAGIAFFKGSNNETVHATSKHATSKKTSLTEKGEKNTVLNTSKQNSNDDQSSSLVEGLNISTPVSSPNETTWNKTGQISFNNVNSIGLNTRIKGLSESRLNEETFASTETIASLKNNQDFDGHLNTIPLKNMFVSGYRSKFKIEELELKSESATPEFSLGNLNLLRKIDQLLSKEIGLSNNQNYDYTVAGQSNLDLNFSAVGTTSQTRFQLMSSMRSLDNPSQLKMTNQVSMDAYSRKMRSGFGIQANYELFGEGLIKTSQVGLIFSPKIALSRNISLEPAIRFKMGTLGLDQTKLSTASLVEQNIGQVNQFQFDPNLAIGKTLWYRDLDAGLTIQTPLFFLSSQLNNIFQHNENIYSNNGSSLRTSTVWNIITGTQYASRNEKVIFSPYALYQQTNYRQQFFGGFTLKAGKAQVGMSYGNLSTGSLSLGYVGENFALIGQSSYSTLSSTEFRTFTHQLTLRIHSSVSKKARRYISL